MTVNIIQAVVKSKLLQVDGRFNVHLEFTDDQGNIYGSDLLAEPSTDLNQKLADITAQLEAQ